MEPEGFVCTLLDQFHDKIVVDVLEVEVFDTALDDGDLSQGRIKGVLRGLFVLLAQSEVGQLDVDLLHFESQPFYVLIEEVDHILLVLRQFVTFVESLQFAQVREVVDELDLEGHVLLDDFDVLQMHLVLQFLVDQLLGIQIDGGVLHLLWIEHQQLILTNF